MHSGSVFEKQQQVEDIKTESREVVLDKSIWSNRFIFNHYKSAKENLKTFLASVRTFCRVSVCPVKKKRLYTHHIISRSTAK